MVKLIKRWLIAAAVVQLVTAILHSLSFIAPRIPANKEERELFALMKNYTFDFGNGFHRSMDDLMIAFSISFALFLFFTAILNFWLTRTDIPVKILSGIVMINLVFYLICTVVMLQFTFLLPVLFLGTIVVLLVVVYVQLRSVKS